MICGTSRIPSDLPDWEALGLDAPCCWGAAIDSACTCWEPVHDLDQQPERHDTVVRIRPDGPCDDCAFRPGSPERAGQPGYENNSPAALDRLVAGARPFWCHDGMRRIVGWRHPDAGVTVPHESTADYDPPGATPAEFPPLRADGSPAFVCAGWDARHRQVVRRG